MMKAWKVILTTIMVLVVGSIMLMPFDGVTAQTDNLALSKPVTFSNQQAGNEAYKAVDGNATTRWAGSPWPQWIQVDLQAVYNINRTELMPYLNRAYQYRVEISTDGTTYTTTVNRTSNTTGGATLTDSFTAVPARYVRLTVTGASGYTGGWVSLYEFRVFGGGTLPPTTPPPTTPPPTTPPPTTPPPTTPPPTTPPPSGNLALNRPVTSSSNENAGLAAANAVDGNTGTRWSSAFSDPQWIYVDLGASIPISRVVLNWEAAYGRSYEIQVSDNPSGSWTSIYSTSTGNGGIDDLTVSGTGRYVQVVGTIRATAYGYSLWEFQVYSGGTPPATTPPPTTPPPTTQPGQAPYGGTAWTVPGTIQAENYDTGGEGVAYHDTTAGNSGSTYRSDGVDIEVCTDSGGGNDVGWTVAGEWLEYTVNIAASGTYSLNARVSSLSGGGVLHVEIDGADITGAMTVPSTGGWQTWTTVTSGVFSLTSGQHILRIAEDAAGFNLNWVSLQSGTIPPPTTPPPTQVLGTAQVIQTSQSGNRLTELPALTFISEDGSSLPTITIDSSRTYQSIIGFGFAFTEATVYNLARTSAANRSQVLNAFFNPVTGAGTNLMRTQIGSSDFSASSYDYDSVAGDVNLVNFSIAHERQWMLPVIREAMAVPGADIKIFASPWSPPAWMKTNNSRTNGGSLRTEYYPTWALYFSKYLTAYAAEGVNIWAVTIQNEPQAVQGFESCIWTAEQERDFLKNNLGPQLALDGLGNVKILVHDHNKQNISRANTILGDPAAAQYAYGTAFHWYGGDYFPSLSSLHSSFPGKMLIGSEVAEPGPKYDWGQAERETHDLIGDLNNWANGWTEWNMVLDERGGPGWTGSVGAAPVHINSTTGVVSYNPHYYYIAHFSKYIRPDAVRIDVANGASNLEVTAFKNTDGKIVVVVMNRSASAVSFKIKQGGQIIKPTVPAHAIANFIYSEN